MVRRMELEQRLRVPESGVRIADCEPGDRLGLTKEEAVAIRERQLEQLAELQERLYAEGTRALLVVFQAMDAAGKDGTIEHVMSGVNPQGVRVTSFKQPTHLELAHDFLWRCSLALPAHGEIGIFNRSHYEEVLVVRVHPEYLAGQGIDPAAAESARFWTQRMEDIVAWERHLARSGTQIVKFFLNVSKAEQRERFLVRASEQEKHWKFKAADVMERRHWDAYQAAYEAVLRHTSTPEAPWYVVPADHKWAMRTAVAAIIVHHLEQLDPRFPQPSPEELDAMKTAVEELAAEG
jgi:PPK2 family polyphosphate:nucleotide phosphotransferase